MCDFVDIQSWWEVPSIAHFCSLFRTAFKLLDFDIEDLEEALLTDGTEEPSWLQELIVLLLKGCLQEHDISLFNYQMFLRRLFRKKCEEYDILNPFNTDIDFELLPLRVKVEILYNLCEFRLDAPDVEDELRNLEADSLRVEPIGYDGKKSAYWYFYGTRLYREDFPKSTKPIWQVVCFTITDWSQLAKKFEASGCKAEQSLYKTLKKNFIPELPRLFLEKETLARQRLLKAKRIPKEDNVLGREDYYTDVVREDIKRHEISRRLERKSFEQVDDHAESRYEMGKSKEKKHKQKDGPADRSVSPTKSKDSKPVGRQTNNSLASATGQILIEPVSNPHKKKMKTSQVFSQSEEDLQVGLHKILDAVKDHEDAWPFVNPVEEEYAPNYYSIIRKPMDLQKMEERLENGHYKTFSKFRTDFQLIVNNCKLYNGVENEYSEMVDTVLEYFNRSVERYLDQVTSSDDEIAVEYSDFDKHKKRKHTETVAKKKSASPEQKKIKVKAKDNDDDEVKVHKKKKEKDKDDKKEKREKDKLKAEKKEKEKENENKRLKVEYREIMSPKKGKKRKADVLEEHKSKRDERQEKLRKQDLKEHKKNKVEEKNKRIEKEKIKSKKSKEVESKPSKKDHQRGQSPKKHNSRKTESKESNIKDKKSKKAVKPVKKGKHSVGRRQSVSRSRSRSVSRSRSRSISRSRSRSLDRWSSSPPPSSIPSSPEVARKVSPSKHKKSSLSKDDIKDKPKSKHDKWKDLFKEDKSSDKSDPIKPKDKHHTLRETIEKLKAKSDLTKIKVEKEKDLKVFDFPNEPKDARIDSKKDAVKKDAVKKKETIVNRKKKLAKELFDDGNSTADSVHSDKKGKFKKAANSANNSKKFDALSLATEQTLKDINKWLDDTPKFEGFSSGTNSPSAFSGIDEFDNNTNKSSDVEKKKEGPAANRKDGDTPIHSNNGNSNSSTSNANSNAKKRPMNRDPTKIFRRKEVQRTIDRLQPGKSKGNLITNVQNKDAKQEETFPLGPLSKIKDTKNSLIVKTDDSAPKLSLGSVLDSFGKHTFIDNDVKKDEEGEADKKSEDKAPLDDNKDDVKCVEVKADSPKLDNSPGTATPNLSAWFKAFGGPKMQSATKKTDVKEEKTVTVDTTMENKKDETRKVALPDPSPNPDSPLMNEQPAARQRKVSTGSSMSERSSFSQDMDSPRVGIDERIGAYPAPYPSPLHKSPAASPSLRSPLPDASFNGQIRVGFYQDTVSTKSSPDKSCSPRDNPQSPYTQYSEHVYTPPTTQNANYSYNNPYYQPNNYSSSNPTPPYNAEANAPSYYDTTKPLTDQYQAKNPNSPVSQQQQPPQSPLMSQQLSPQVQSQPSPIDMQHYQQPHSPAVNQQVHDAYARQTQTRSPLQPQQPSPQQHLAQQTLPAQQVATTPQDKFMYGAQQVQSPSQQMTQLDAGTYRSTLEYGRQQAPPNVEPFRTNEPKLQQATNSYPVKKRVYNEIEQSTQRTYDETLNAQSYPTRDPPKYIHQNIPEPRLSSQVHAAQQAPPQVPQQQNSVNQFPPATYNYPTDASHQYPPLNIPATGRMGSLDESRKVDMSKYTNMGYTGPDINLHLSRAHAYKQAAPAAPGQSDALQQQQQRFRECNALNNYKAPSTQSATGQSTERPTYHGSAGQLDIDQSLSLRGLSHIVERYPNEESRMLGLQGNPPPAYYSDKNLPPHHMFSGKPGATSASTLPMFSQASSMPPYGVQTHPNMYNRQMTELQVPMSQSQPQPAQQQAPAPQPAAAPEPKPKKKRMTKAAKAAAAAAAAAQAQQQQQTSNTSTNNESTPAAGQGFQSYAGLKTSTSSMEPSAISLKTASVVPGSAFNFGPSTTGLPMPPGLYGDKDAYPNFLDDFRTGPSNYYMAAAAAAHHRSTPENSEKAPSNRVPGGHQASNPSSASAPSTASYPFIGAPQPRPPSYPLSGVPPFMPPHQAPLMDSNSPQYLQYLQAGVLHQGLLPPGAYAAPGYHPALSIRQQYDSMTRPPWL